MARPPKHDWMALYEEYITGGYETVTSFAEIKGIHPFAVQREFRKLKAQEPNKTKPKNKTKQNPVTQQNKTKPDPFPGQCKATSHKKGQRCRAKAMEGSDYCRRHADAIEGQCTARSKQSGERCKNKALPGKNVCKFHGGNGGCPTGTQNAIKHGFFAKIFPDDKETRALVSEIIEKDPLDILWENIMIQYVAIARAQKIMFVKDKDDLTEHLKRQKETHGLSSEGWEKEWELQYAWDKHASFLKAQSQAMQTIERLIQRYDALIQSGHGSEEHQLKLDKLKAQIENIKAGGDDNDLLDEALDEEDLG